MLFCQRNKLRMLHSQAFNQRRISLNANVMLGACLAYAGLRVERVNLNLIHNRLDVDV